MVAIQSAVGPVAKDRKNTQQGYSFRGIADAYRALQRLMAHHGVHASAVAIDEISRREGRTRGGGIMWYLTARFTYRFYHVSGTHVDVMTIGEGMDTGDKCSGKAMSTAHKYALFQAFCIPEDNPIDVENDSPEMHDDDGAKEDAAPEKPAKKKAKRKSSAEARAEHDTAKANGYQTTPSNGANVVPIRNWEGEVVELHAELAQADRDTALGLLDRLKQVPEEYREALRVAFKEAMGR